MNEFFNALKNKRARKELIKSMIVGTTATVLDFLVTAVILFIEGHNHFTNFFSVFTGATVDGLPHVTPTSIYLTAIVLSFLVSFLFNYIMSVFFVYEYGNVGKNKKGFVKFLIFTLIGLSITTLGNFLGHTLLHGNVWLVKWIVILIVFIFNFFTRKYFIFNIALINDDENTINL